MWAYEEIDFFQIGFSCIEKKEIVQTWSKVFFVNLYLTSWLPGVALKSALAQKYAFTKKSTIFTQSLWNIETWPKEETHEVQIRMESLL